MHCRDKHARRAVGAKRCVQLLRRAALTTDNRPLTTAPKSLRFIYGRLKAYGSNICEEFFAKYLILHVAQMGEGGKSLFPLRLSLFGPRSATPALLAKSERRMAKD